MSDPSEAPGEITIRTATAQDRDFVLAIAERFVAFELPPWRERDENLAGLRRDIEKHLRERPEGSHFFVAEMDGVRAGILHLIETVDFFTGAPNCHVSDIATAEGSDGHGIGSRLLAFAEDWARRRGCRFMTLSVFPANARARALYERQGFGVELLRMTKPLR